MPTFMMVILAAFGFIALTQWDKFSQLRRIDEGLEAPGPVGRFQPIDAGVDGVVILDTATGQLWHRPHGDPSSAWEKWAPPVPKPEPGPANKPPAWDDFGRPSATSATHPSAVSSDRR